MLGARRRLATMSSAEEICCRIWLRATHEKRMPKCSTPSASSCHTGQQRDRIRLPGLCSLSHNKDGGGRAQGGSSSAPADASHHWQLRSLHWQLKRPFLLSLRKARGGVRGTYSLGMTVVESNGARARFLCGRGCLLLGGGGGISPADAARAASPPSPAPSPAAASATTPASVLALLVGLSLTSGTPSGGDIPSSSGVTKAAPAHEPRAAVTLNAMRGSPVYSVQRNTYLALLW